MAGDWIAMRVDLADDPAVIQIAAALGMDVYAVVGRLHKVWAWAGSQTTDGHVRVTLPALLSSRSRHASVTLTSFINAHVGVTDFAQAMESVGWLVCTDDGIRFPNFDRWNSQTAKQRLLAARRSAQYRAGKSSRLRHGESVTKSSPTEQNRTDTSVLRTEERGSRRSPPKNATVEVVIPDSLNTPTFLAAWEEWLAFRREARHTVKPNYLVARLAELAKLGPDLAAQCLDYSTNNRYQGLFPDRFTNRQKQQNLKPNSDAVVMQQIIEGMQEP